MACLSTKAVFLYQLLTSANTPSLTLLPQSYPVSPVIPLHLSHQYHGVNRKSALHWCYLKIRQMREFGDKTRCHKEPEEHSELSVVTAAAAAMLLGWTKRRASLPKRSTSVNTACRKLCLITRNKRKTRDPICHKRCFKHYCRSRNTEGWF